MAREFKHTRLIANIVLAALFFGLERLGYLPTFGQSWVPTIPRTIFFVLIVIYIAGSRGRGAAIRALLGQFDPVELLLRLTGSQIEIGELIHARAAIANKTAVPIQAVTVTENDLEGYIEAKRADIDFEEEAHLRKRYARGRRLLS